MSVVYRTPGLLLIRFGVDALIARRRSFKRDSQACINSHHPPLQVLGTQHIPHRGPCLILINHYYRRGFPIWWLVMGVSSVLPADARWVMTSEWTAPGKWYEPIKGMFSRFMLSRVARVYDFWSMPPMPPRAGDVEARARAVRRVLTSLDRMEKPVLCLAPEGSDMPDGKLGMPPPGVGRFLMLLGARGLPIQPVGGWETEEGALCIRFGESFELRVPRGLTPEEKDRRGAEEVMRRLAGTLPLHLRGEFA